jgi:phosphoglycerate kinase
MIRYLSKVPPSKLTGTALVRLDFNTEGAWRMERAIPTLRLLLRHASHLVIISHRGRPSAATLKAGKPVGSDRKLSLRRDARDLERMLRRPVRFIPHFDFPRIKREVAVASRGSVFLLENIRFLKGESTKRPELAKRLASIADYYVNDAFAVCHHAGDSVTRVERFLPSYAGLELQEEIDTLCRVLRHPKKPVVIVIGGAKAGDKLGMLGYFRRTAKCFLIGGASANTLLSLRGVDVKRSLMDTDPADRRKLRAILKYRNLVLPVDVRHKKGAILDIGPRTTRLFIEKLRAARTIIWTGPMGRIEEKPYDRGSIAVAKAIAANRRAFSVTGGGETVALLKKHHLDKKFSFISTGGGAMLEFLAGEKLPGIAALERQGRASPKRREALKHSMKYKA